MKDKDMVDLFGNRYVSPYGKDACRNTIAIARDSFHNQYRQMCREETANEIRYRERYMRQNMSWAELMKEGEYGAIEEADYKLREKYHHVSTNDLSFIINRQIATSAKKDASEFPWFLKEKLREYSRRVNELRHIDMQTKQKRLEEKLRLEEEMQRLNETGEKLRLEREELRKSMAKDRWGGIKDKIHGAFLIASLAGLVGSVIAANSFGAYNANPKGGPAYSAENQK